MKTTDLNQYIKKSHINAVNKFNVELSAFAKECGEEEATLYEDINTSFTLSNVRLEDGKMLYNYDGCEESDTIVKFDWDENDYYEEDNDGIMEALKYWRSCLRRAKRYWAMDCDTLDKMSDGEMADIDEDD